MNHPYKDLLILADKTRILKESFSSIFILKDHCTALFNERKPRCTEAQDRIIYKIHKISDDLSIQQVQLPASKTDHAPAFFRSIISTFAPNLSRRSFSKWLIVILKTTAQPVLMREDHHLPKPRIEAYMQYVTIRASEHHSYSPLKRPFHNSLGQWFILVILRNINPKNENFLKKYLIIWFQKNTKNKTFFEKIINSEKNSKPSFYENS